MRFHTIFLRPHCLEERIKYVHMSECSYVIILSWTEESVKAGTCAHDKRVLQQLALDVHVKHSDLTYVSYIFMLCGFFCFF